MTMAEETRRWAASEVMRHAEAHEWPPVDPVLIGASSIQSEWGPGREEWEAFVRWATTNELRYIANAFVMGMLPYKAPIEGAPAKPRRPAPRWAPVEPVRAR